MTEVIEMVIRRAIGVFCLGMWAIVGFIYWIPLLARACGTYSGAVLMSAVANRPIKKAGDVLNYASNFYLKGFQNIQNAIRQNDDVQHRDSDDDSDINPFSSWEEFAKVSLIVGRETAIALLFWAIVFFILK